jgi:hypothetical protein
MSDTAPALAVPETMKAVTKFTAEHAHEVGLPTPEAINYMMSVSSLLINSTLVTPDMGQDEKTIKANAMAKMLVGHEMGIQPMAAMQDIDIVKNRVFLRYPQLIDQMLRKGFALKWLERSDERAALEVTRPNMSGELYEYTIADAKKAGLLSGSKPEYNQYLLRPRVMLTARVVSEAYRTTGGRGNVYTPEEKAEIFGGQESTMAPPTDDDKLRTEVIAAQSEQYKVGLKAKPAPTPEPKAAAPAPQPAPEPAPAPVAPKTAPAPAPKPAPPVPQQPATSDVTYEIHNLRSDGSIERMQSEYPQKRREMACLRAQALANETKGEYHVMERTAGPNGGSLVEVAKYAPPSTTATAPATPAPVTTPAAPVTADPPPVSPLKQRLLKITMSVEAQINKGITVEKNITPTKTVAARVKSFLSGYFGVAKLSDLPADTDAYTDAFADLESVATRDVNVLFSAPEDTGKRMAADNAKFAAYYTSLNWPADTIAVARKLARQWGLDASDQKMYIQNVGLDMMQAEDAHAALRLAVATRSAGKFVQQCVAHNMSKVADAVAVLESNKLKAKLEDCTEKQVAAAIEWAMAAIKEEAAKPAAPPAPKPQAKAPVDEPEDDLFGNLP